MIAMQGFHRANMLFTKGQDISNGYADVQRSLEDYFLAKQPSNQAERDVLTALMRRYGNKAPIRPQNAIDLDRNTGLVGTGLLLTYIIVLMQFKLGEGGGGMNCNSTANGTVT